MMICYTADMSKEPSIETKQPIPDIFDVIQTISTQQLSELGYTSLQSSLIQNELLSPRAHTTATINSFGDNTLFAMRGFIWIQHFPKGTQIFGRFTDPAAYKSPFNFASEKDKWHMGLFLQHDEGLPDFDAIAKLVFQHSEARRVTNNEDALHFYDYSMTQEGNDVYLELPNDNNKIYHIRQIGLTPDNWHIFGVVVRN